MVANGLANLGAGLFQGFVVNGSLSKTAADEQAGGRTQAVSLVCAGLTLATILFLTGLFTYLPEATLGAIVIAALRKYFSPAGLVRLYRVRRPDFLLSVSAVLGVLVFGVLPGVAIGVVLSLALLIMRESSPNSAVLGRSPDGDHFADVVTHPGYEQIPGLLVYRFDGPLVFPNAERFAREVRTLARSKGPPETRVRAVILDLEAVADMDTTAADQLADLVASLRRSDVRVILARPHGSLRAFLEKDGLIATLGDGEVFPRVREAVASFSQDDGRTSRVEG
jgi:MFS superfamily sulfate permease-like transporter